MVHRGTWDGDVFQARSIPEHVDFHWSQDMDLDLRELVEQCEFDFSWTASVLRERCQQGLYGVTQKFISEKIDEELCRSRFNRFEAE